jgi:hypothetical protein
MTTSTTWVSILDVTGLTHEEFDKLLVHMGVESNPEPGLYLHATTSFNENTGLRVIEIWDEKEGFESFVQKRLIPATEALGIHRDTKITTTPLHNAFAPRLMEIPSLPQERKR